MLKRVIGIVALLALLAMVGLAGIWLYDRPTNPALAQTTPEAIATEYSPHQTIVVVGQGTAHVRPDIARISIGVETRAETVTGAVQENETQMEAILAALKAAGVADKDIQTMNYSLYFEQYPESVSGGEKVKPQYRVSNMVQVTARDLEKIGDLLDAVIEAGANNIWGVNFSIEDSRPAQAQARAEAIADARARAEALAELSGVRLGPVMSVSEVVSGGTYVVPVAMERAAAGGSGTITPGELEVAYQVQVTYFIAGPAESATGLPNPASKFCQDQGYKLEIRTAADGSQTGYCLFPDGTECEEWAFYRGECGPGTPRP